MLIIYVQGVMGMESLSRVDSCGSAPRTSAACSSSIVKIGKKHDFVQILGLKTPISVDRNFEHLTSEGSVARNFEISSSLTPFLQNMDIDGPN